MDLRQLIDQSLDSVPIPSGVDVEVSFKHSDSRCELDAEQVTQVITNLVNNAVAAMPEGGRLWVETDDTPDQIGFTVRDNGVGIRLENRDRIFRPFFTTKAIGRGTGLGLAVVYGIVKMHRGQIHVDSNADAAQGPTGTAFRVTLPRWHRSEPVPTMEAS